MKRLTGAQVVALGADAAALESGRDNSAIGARNFEPVRVDRVIEDGATVTLGGVTLRALWTSGHTQGATMLGRSLNPALPVDRAASPVLTPTRGRKW